MIMAMKRDVVDGTGGLVDFCQMRDLDRRRSRRIGRDRLRRSCVILCHEGRSLGHCGVKRKGVRAACKNGPSICDRDLVRLS